jgi:hypothetical protein
MMNNRIIIYSILVIILIIYLSYSKDTFQTLKQIRTEEFDEYNRVHSHNNHSVLQRQEVDQRITKSYLENLLKESLQNSNYANGPPQGANTTLNQNKYDLIFKDIIVDSKKRNYVKYPNPNQYQIDIGLEINKIYKAELIDVNVPAATDDTVNIPADQNRLYFSYSNTTNSVTTSTTGYVIIQPGTYLSPTDIAEELSRQFCLVLASAGFRLTKYIGVCVTYSKNLNRYIFQDRDFNVDSSILPTLIIYPNNEYVIDLNNTVTNSIAPLLMLNYTTPTISQPYLSGPKFIDSADGVLYVSVAQPGDYGEYSGTNVPLNRDSIFSNCIMSDLVLTDCGIYLSISKLNGSTCTIVPDQSGKDQNIPPVFCQVPNNTVVSSASVKTLLGQPQQFSAIQFYNPVISKLNNMDIRWYTDDGSLVRILDHCFTIRVYYFQKRLDTTDFSYYIP